MVSAARQSLDNEDLTIVIECIVKCFAICNHAAIYKNIHVFAQAALLIKQVAFYAGVVSIHLAEYFSKRRSVCRGISKVREKSFQRFGKFYNGHVINLDLQQNKIMTMKY